MSDNEKTMTNASYPTAEKLYRIIRGFLRDDDIIVSDWRGFLEGFLCEDDYEWEDEDDVWRNDDEFIERIVPDIADLFGVSIDPLDSVDVLRAKVNELEQRVRDYETQLDALGKSGEVQTQCEVM